MSFVMNVLEKILEDVEKLEDPYYKDYVDRKHVAEIIRSHKGEVSDMHGKRLIDANALDEEVRNFFLAITGNPKQATVVKECKESFRRMIDEQPTVYEANDWIPVEEKLPEESGYYLVQLSKKLANEDYSDRVVALYDGTEKEFMCYAKLIIAWQPLPEPYKQN